jgi:hypothetical protein
MLDHPITILSPCLMTTYIRTLVLFRDRYSFGIDIESIPFLDRTSVVGYRRGFVTLLQVRCCSIRATRQFLGLETLEARKRLYKSLLSGYHILIGVKYRIMRQIPFWARVGKT